VDTAADGLEALKKANEIRPQGMVLDVGLPGIYGFDLCARLKGDPDTGSIKIVLVSSVYDMRRYKRTPVSLYGADDYIEKHHIHDLPTILRKLLFPEKYADAPLARESRFHDDLPEMARPPDRSFESSLLSPDTLAQMEQEIPQFTSPPKHGHLITAPDTPITPDSISLDASIFQKEEFEFPGVKEADPDAVEKAKRFARIIVSDIALYNQVLVVEGIKNDTFYELLKNDVQEGRELYDKRVPAAIRRGKDYFQEAFDNFITAARRKLQNR
jgi:CheY-like chemotaxis protein